MDQPPAKVTVKPAGPLGRGNLDRKFGVLDAMILVAAGAAGSMSIRPFLLHGRHMQEFYGEFLQTPGIYFYVSYLFTFINFMGPWLASLTLAFLAIRLRGPRPPFRRLMRQPGMIACAAASFLLACEAFTAAAVFAILVCRTWKSFTSNISEVLPYRLRPP